MEVLANRNDLKNMKLMYSSMIKHPLFRESEVIDRLLLFYNAKPLVDLMNTNTVIKDDKISFVIVTDTYYILLLKKQSLHLIIRDNVNVYKDSIMKPTWKMTTKCDNNSFLFNITSENCSTYLIYIKNNIVHFNSSVLKYKDSKLRRIIAVTI